MLLGWECGWLGGVRGWHKQAANKSWDFLLHVGRQLFLPKLYTLEICICEERRKYSVHVNHQGQKLMDHPRKRHRTGRRSLPSSATLITPQKSNVNRPVTQLPI